MADLGARSLLRIQAHANRLANHRLHQALARLAALDPHALTAPRTGFFPSLLATLNHLLAVDLYYIGALHGDAAPDQAFQAFVPPTGLQGEQGLAMRQQRSDQRLIDWFERAEDADLARVVSMPRGGGRVQHDCAAHMLTHLFMHQAHHRGQAHGMLSGTVVAPPQLDEFLMPSEAHLRHVEMAELGWSEPVVYGGFEGPTAPG